MPKRAAQRCGLLLGALSLAACATAELAGSSLATVYTLAEPAGDNCPEGGTAIRYGLDANADAVLDETETERVLYACNGASGTDGEAGAPGETGATGEAGVDGVDGASGLDSLVRVTDEAAGAHCDAGGKKIEVGPDTNRDGVLDPDTEASSTSYVCNGVSPAPTIDLILEDFEDGFSDWSLSNIEQTAMLEAPGADGTLQALGITGGSTIHHRGIRLAVSTPQPDEISFYVRSGSTTASDGYLVFGDNAVSSGNAAVFFYMRSNGTITCYDGSTWRGATPYVADFWYHIRFALRWDAQTFDFYINGNLVDGNIPFRGNVTQMSWLSLYNYDNSAAQWDEIRFR